MYVIRAGRERYRDKEMHDVKTVIAVDPDHPLRLALLEGRDVVISVHLLAPILRIQTPK
jgi:hypothetical protein